MYGAEKLWRKECVSFKGPKQKGIDSEMDTFWGSLEIPTILTTLVLWGRGCFIVVELSMVIVSVRTIPRRYWGTAVDPYHDLPLSNKKEWIVNICNNLGGADCEEAQPPKLQTVCFHLHNIPEMTKWWNQKTVATVTSQGGGRSERGPGCGCIKG